MKSRGALRLWVSYQHRSGRIAMPGYTRYSLDIFSPLTIHYAGRFLSGFSVSAGIIEWDAAGLYQRLEPVVSRYS